MSDDPTKQNDHSEDRDPAYQVLARKYRPQNFDDLIGHEAMVKTLRNAFSSGRIAHAYVLTGVRGVGKTTTARILARALNYVGEDGTDNGPQIDMTADGLHCKAIAESRHPDVLEMDAASRTGVADIRELIEGVRYAPVEARYKVYIIDEVHMLSTQAFNALLKTLEEPPAHVKFIFATTEIRKLPVTVLSRCQRFDLRRIDPDTLVEHLTTIATKEGSKVDPEGMNLITRAAEGSVRDALSILDQALVQENVDKNATSAENIRTMLGLADRTRTWDLLRATFSGNAKDALSIFKDQYDAGADPIVIIRDLLELVHLLTKVKAAGPDAAKHGAAGEADEARANEMANGLQMSALTRSWSLLMTGLQETRIAPDPAAAGEMSLIRLAYAANLPTPDEALKALNKNSDASQGARPQASTSQGVPSTQQRLSSVGTSSGSAPAVAVDDPAPNMAPAAVIKNFQDVARLAAKNKDAKLHIELESYVHIVAFQQGRIEMRLDDRAPTDLAGRLTRALKNWTGQKWIVSVTANKEGAATIRNARTAEVMSHSLVQKTFSVFPDAKLKSIRDAQQSDFTNTPDEPSDASNTDPNFETI